MPKHFETLWEEAEAIAARALKDQDIFAEIRQQLSDLEDIDVQSTAISTKEKEANKSEIFGELLFRVCLIAHRLNINSYPALQNCIDNARVDELDPDIRFE